MVNLVIYNWEELKDMESASTIPISAINFHLLSARKVFLQQQDHLQGK